MLASIHKASVYSRRVSTLARMISKVLPSGSRVLDVGSGDGEIASQIMGLIDVEIIGIDVVPRLENKIPISIYDGKSIPYPDASFDVVIVSDVLHHTDDPVAALAEVARVSSARVVIKDHLCEGVVSFVKLKVMDWAGNSYHGVSLPYNYLNHEQWAAAFKKVGLEVESWEERVPLYSWPLQMMFGRNLHFVASLKKAQSNKNVSA